MGNKDNACVLCGHTVPSFACSHIIARGFYNGLSSKTNVTMMSSDGEKRKRPNAHYIEDKICHDCEREIFKDLDEYAIAIYCQKDGGHVEPPGGCGDNSMYVFEDVDRRKLRAFWASLLWRFSIAGIWELNGFTIGDCYNRRIRDDLLDYKNREFNYIDSLVMFLTCPNAEMYFMPRRFRLAWKGSDAINAYEIRLPSLGAYVSLDQRPHPMLEHFKWTVGGKRISASLDKESEGSMLAVANRSVMVDDVERFVEMYRVHKERRENWLESMRQSSVTKKGQR